MICDAGGVGTLRRKNRPRRRWCLPFSQPAGQTLAKPGQCCGQLPEKRGGMSAEELGLMPARPRWPCGWHQRPSPAAGALSVSAGPCRLLAGSAAARLPVSRSPNFQERPPNAPVPRSPFWGSGCQCRCKARQRPRCPAGQLLLPPGRLGAVRAPQGFLSVSVKTSSSKLEAASCAPKRLMLVPVKLLPGRPCGGGAEGYNPILPLAQIQGVGSVPTPSMPATKGAGISDTLLRGPPSPGIFPLLREN